MTAPALTIFCTAKPFIGHAGVIQKNALKSWTLLRPRPEVLLIGDEEGYAEAARELGLRHVPDVECNDRGLPLISSLFSTASAEASHSILCYLDADVVLMSDFLPALETVSRAGSRFLMMGGSRSVEVTESLDFEIADWEARLGDHAASNGWSHGSWWGIDYFAFPRGCLPELPPFAVGRPGWDNWLVYLARSLRILVIDAERVVTAIHQDHDYSNVQGGQDFVWAGPEAVANQRLVGGDRYVFSLGDSTHILTARGLKPARTAPYLWRRIYTAPLLHPRLRFLGPPLRLLLSLTRRLRGRTGLTMARLAQRSQ